MNDLLLGRRAVVTGTGAIGRAIIARLAEAGAAVAVWDRDATSLANVSGAAATYLVDVTSHDDVAAVAARTIGDLGGVDVVVTAAAIATFAPVATMSADIWRRMIDVNLTGVFLTCQAFLSAMAAGGGGSIVNISSIGGLRGEPEYAHYCAAKFGVIGFSQSLAREVGVDGIRVNCVAPGAIDSPMNTDTMARDARLNGVDIEDVADRIRAKVALHRIGSTSDVADTVLYLASDLSSYVSGETIAVTGGVF